MPDDSPECEICAHYGTLVCEKCLRHNLFVVLDEDEDSKDIYDWDDEDEDEEE